MSPATKSYFRRDGRPFGESNRYKRERLDFFRLVISSHQTAVTGKLLHMILLNKIEVRILHDMFAKLLLIHPTSLQSSSQVSRIKCQESRVLRHCRSPMAPTPNVTVVQPPAQRRGKVASFCHHMDLGQQTNGIYGALKYGKMM
jgi:hypothetical protein